MPSNKPKVFAYLPQELYSQVIEFKNQGQYSSDSQALVAILTEFFNSKPKTVKEHTNIEQRIERLEQMFDGLNLMVLKLLDASSSVPSELEETNRPEETSSSVLSELEETSSVPSELEETSSISPNKDNFWVLCKVDRIDSDHPLYWTGSSKTGFIDNLWQARVYTDLKGVKQALRGVEKTHHSADTSKQEFLRYDTVGNLKKRQMQKV